LVAELARVGIDNISDPLVDVTASGTGATRARSVSQPLHRLEFVAVEEPFDPVIDRTPTDAESLGDLLGRLALIEPKQRLGTASLLAHGVVRREEFQLRALQGRENERGHRFTCGKARVFDGSL